MKKKDIKKAIILDMDETLEHGVPTDRENITMFLRPNIDELLIKLQEAKEQGVDIILCTTANSLWVNRFLDLKPEFRNIFDKIFCKDNRTEWNPEFDPKHPVEKALRIAKPVTAFGYDSILFIDDAPAAKSEIKHSYIDECAILNTNLINFLENILPEKFDELYSDDMEFSEEEEIEIFKNMLRELGNKTDYIIPSEDIDTTYFTGFAWSLDKMDIDTILGCMEDSTLNPEALAIIKQYIDIINKEPGCKMMCSAIDDFIKKSFSPGLTLLDENYVKQYKEYKEQLKALQGKISEFKIECPEKVFQKYMATDKIYPYEGIIEQSEKIIPAEALASALKVGLIPDDITKAKDVEQSEIISKNIREEKQ